jgi:hypothetical protein
MSFSDYGTYLSIVGIVFGLGPVLDKLFNEHAKAKALHALTWFVMLPERNLSLRFYRIICVASLLMTALAVANVGGIESLTEGGPHFRVTLKSTGPLIIALLLKITFYDYIMAAKSSDLMRALKARAVTAPKQLAFIAVDIKHRNYATSARGSGKRSCPCCHSPINCDLQ